MRLRRNADRFVLRSHERPALIVARLTAEAPTMVEARIGDRIIGTDFVSGGFREVRFVVPGSLAAGRMVVSVAAQAGGRFGSAHYWLLPAATQ